jgi:dihydropyrimidine dehydrogenase (NAD+) subunit PreA
MADRSLVAREEAARCLLCHDAPCTAACPRELDPARLVRAVRFDDGRVAARSLAGCASCLAALPAGERAPCVRACVHYDYPIRLPELRAAALADAGETPLPAGWDAVDLSVDFCGVRCENPFFLSSSVVASGYDMCAKALRMGWAGVVYKTIGAFVPEEVSPRFAAVGKEGTPFIGFRNLEQISDHPLEENLEVLRRLKRDFPEKVIVISIMGQSEAEWTSLARLSTEAGADIIECNFSCPHMSGESLGSDVGQDPDLVARFTAATRRGTSLPILAKMTPNLGHIEPPAVAAIRAGANGIAAINTIKSVAGLDADSLASAPAVAGKSAVSGYSGKAVKPIALRFISDLARCANLAGVPISGMGGIETWRDALDFILLGCANVQVTTAVMQYGYRIIDDLVAGLRLYMAERGVARVSDLVGRGVPQVVGADRLDRSTLSYPAFDRAKCVGCGRCHLACADAGHQAIDWPSNPTAARSPRLEGKKCVGCHLCLYVCPTGAISPARRVEKKGARI